MAHVWSAFLCLNDTRIMGERANPITYSEIESFMKTTATTLSSRDVETIKRLDKVYLGVMNG